MPKNVSETKFCSQFCWWRYGRYGRLYILSTNAMYHLILFNDTLLLHVESLITIWGFWTSLRFHVGEKKRIMKSLPNRYGRYGRLHILSTSYVTSYPIQWYIILLCRKLTTIWASGHHFVFMLRKKNESWTHYPTGMAGMVDYSNLYIMGYLH